MTRLFPTLRYLSIPNALTTGSIVLGVCTAVLVARGRPRMAAILYLGVLLSDRVDGMVARRLRQTSEFGKHLDSFADLLNFCVLPLVAGYALGLRAPWQIAAGALFLVAGVWRLAYFNLHDLDVSSGRPCFVGVCTAHAAALLVILGSVSAAAGFHPGIVASAGAAVLGLLMVSGLRVPKNGAFTASLYVATPLSVLALHLAP